MNTRIWLLQKFLTMTTTIIKASSAKDISNKAWITPRMPPIIRAGEADVMLLLSVLVFTILQQLACKHSGTIIRL